MSNLDRRERLRKIGLVGGVLACIGTAVITVWFGIALILLAVLGPDTAVPVWFEAGTPPVAGGGGAVMLFGMLIWCAGYGARELIRKSDRH